MQKKKTQNIPLILSLLALGGIGTSLLLFAPKTEKAPKPPVFVVTAPPPTTSPATPATPATLASPDGTHVLTLSYEDTKITLSANDHVVLTKNVVDSEEFVLPFNAWSPDNRYFFVEDKKEQHSTYIVMKVDGATVAEDVGALFVQAQPELTLLEVTGWASPTLLVLNARSNNESTMSFWFDVQTKKFIRLSTYFN